MKNITLALALLLGTATAFAQQSKKGPYAEKRAEIEKQKVAYITTQLELTPEEAKSFWPVYNMYTAELEKHRGEMREERKEMRGDASSMSDSEIDASIKAKFDAQQKKLDTETAYYEKFKTVLPVSKVAALYKAERGFKRELMKKMRDGRGEKRNMQERRMDPATE